MKLYFYFLDTMNGRIREEEREVKEKKETYKILGDAPHGHLGKIVYKSDIGKLKLSFQYYMILTNKDIESVSEAFTSVCKNDINGSERAIKGYRIMVNNLQRTIENIEKWRSENAKQ